MRGATAASERRLFLQGELPGLNGHIVNGRGSAAIFKLSRKCLKVGIVPRIWVRQPTKATAPFASPTPL